MIQSDPHGIAAVFAERLVSNLKIMTPEAATKDAIRAVEGFVVASKFLDMTSKETPPGEREYLRVWKSPEETGGSASPSGGENAPR